MQNLSNMMLEDSLLVSSINEPEPKESCSVSSKPENTNDNYCDQNESEKMVNTINNKNKNMTSNVVIHVCDESRNLEKSFECNRQLLIEKMTYFGQYLNTDEQEDDEEVDISVHCDILVFEWLIQYISSNNKPKLEIHNVVSILISSHFLQMNVLVDECVDFISKYLNDIIQLPLDLSCLNDEIIQKISAKFSISTIDLLNDPSDKIISRLYRHHLEIFIKAKENKLFYCVYCGELYTKKQRKKIICYKAQSYINFHGEIVRKHCAQRGWYICKYLLGLRLQNYSWKSIYWHLWSLTRPPLFCNKCNEYIIVPNLYHCTFHSKEAISGCNKGLNTSSYPCCQTKQNNFEIIQTQKKGCCHKQHQITSFGNSEHSTILNVVSTHSQYVLIPFEASTSCSVSSTNKRFLERPQSADHRSRLIKHSHHSSKRFGMNHSSKRFSVNSPLKITGVWDKKYFVFGSQCPSKVINRNHINNSNNILDFDIYHKPITFWYNDEEDEENRNKNNNNDDITEESFEYLSYLLTFDNIDYGEGEEDTNNPHHNQTSVFHDNTFEGDDEDVFTDDGSVDIEDVHDVMFFHSTQNGVSNVVDGAQKVDNKTTNDIPSSKNNKKKSKALPLRGRRLKTMPRKGRESTDNKNSSAFDIQQNDIRRLDALMKSLSLNRQD